MTAVLDEIRVRRRAGQAAIASSGERLHPVLSRVLANRGIKSVDEIDYALAHLQPPAGMGDLDRAAARIAEAVKANEPTLIVGDFDADGATGSAVCVLALRAMGLTDVDFVVPDRFSHGYGLSSGLVDDILASRQPTLLVTVDNGISSIAGTDRAAAAGIDVVITDHHLPGEALPRAHAIVNPNLADADFPSKSMAGVGVAFYTMLAVRKFLDAEGWFGGRRPMPNLSKLLDLVALGTVADVVSLDYNNRILVSQGLRRIRHGRCRPGIAALLSLAGRDLGRVNAADLGFAVAPRLNAAGRLDDMGVGIRCLLADTEDEAREQATVLHQLNAERRRIQTDMERDAIGQLEGVDASRRVLCAMDPGWHQGVVGLVASRMKEQWHRPSIALAPEAEGSTVLKGSARSIPGFHIRDALAWVDARHPGLIVRFGGHAMAAGLTMERQHLETFEAALQACAAETLPDALLEREIWTDGELGGNDLSVSLAATLRDWGPWGQAFPEPVFDGWFQVQGRRAIGARHTKLSVQSERGGPTLDALLFNRPIDRVPETSRIHLVYALEINEYLGNITPQLVVRHVVGAA